MDIDSKSNNNSTSETFDDYVHNVTNVQHKYTWSLHETSVVINQDRLSLRNKVKVIFVFLKFPAFTYY